MAISPPCYIVVFALFTLFPSSQAGGAAPDLYPYLSSLDHDGPLSPSSPDPTQTLRWTKDVNTTILQQYYLAPSAISSSMSSEFHGSTLSTPTPYLSGRVYRNPQDASGNVNISITQPTSIMIDFGVENAGWLEFDSSDIDASSTQLLMSVSEYILPEAVNSGPKHPNKTAEPVAYRSDSLTTFRLELNDLLYEGVRYGWIDIASVVKPFHISSIRLVCQIKPQSYEGWFESSETVLEQVWWTAAYTVRLNLMSDYMGSILIDRGDRYSWTGDAHTIQAASYSAFGNDDFILNNINRTACATCSNNIESYALYWVLSLCDYFWETGQDDVFAMFAENAIQKLEHAVDIYGKNPSLTFYGGDERVGSYFEDPSCQESQNAYKMLVIRALMTFNSTAHAAELGSSGTKYGQIAETFISQLRESGEWWSAFGMHAAADAINAGFLTADELDGVLKVGFANTDDIVSFTPFNQFFIVSALFRANQTSLAMKAIRECWGGMLSLGATTFWETYSPQWNHIMAGDTHIETPGTYRDVNPPPNGQNGYTSLCHPWAGGVVYLLQRYVVGLKANAGGYDEFEIDVSHFARGVEGQCSQGVPPRVSSTHGVNGMTVLLNRSCDGTVLVGGARNAPAGSKASFVIPRAIESLDKPDGDLQIQSISVTANGVGVAHWPTSDAAEVTFTVSDNDVTVSHLVCEGSCEVSVTFDADPGFAGGEEYLVVSKPIPLLSSFSSSVPSALFVGEDKATGGSWRSVYGNAGYALFAYNDDLSPLLNAPNFVKTIDAHRGGSVVRTVHYPDDLSSESFLMAPPPESPESPRKLGALATSNPAACTQSYVLDIEITDARPYNVSLYFADADHMSRVQVIEVFDLETKGTVAPWVQIKNFEGGAYLTWQYDRSIRFRIAYVRADAGADATLSAVFFDRQ